MGAITSAGVLRLSTWVRQELFSRADGRFPALDGLRALAALLIVFFHSAVAIEQTGPAVVNQLPTDWVRWSLERCWIGVDVFFVLSGFLIGRILLAQLREGTIDFKAFYIRRVFRIFPAYYVVLTLSVFVLARFDIVYGKAPWEDLLHRSAASYAYVSNYVYGARVPISMEWGWSLCIEEHFYLVVPLLLALLFKWTTSGVRTGILLALPLVPVSARAIAFFRQPSIFLWQGLNWESHTHCDGLLLGVVLAYFFVWHHDALSRFASRLTALGLIVALGCFASVLVWGGAFGTGFFPVVLQFLILALGTALVVATGLFSSHGVAGWLAHPFWYPIARVSYGIYLIHLFVVMWLLSLRPGVYVTLATSPAKLLIFAAIAAFVTFVAASILFLTIELPFLHWGMRLSRRAITAPAATAECTAPSSRGASSRLAAGQG